ncbi:MAG: oligosaccharide flippase family protein [Gammaproteobacteria bacterium]|nr:oligosaccharide flippase family protein [Gammaproteobacteria bacterium]
MIRLTLPAPLRQHAFYALGIVVMKGVSFFMLPFVARHLSPDEFGRLEILTSLGAVGGIVVGFGLLNALFRFAGMAGTEADRHQIVAESFGLNLVIGATALACGLVLTDSIAQALPGGVARHLVQATLVMVALEACIAIPLGWLRMEERAGVFFALNSSKAIVQALLVVLFLRQGKGIDGVIEAGLIATLLLSAVLAWLQWRDTGIRFRISGQWQMLRYSLPLVGSGLLGFALTGLDRWVLADAVGPGEMASYAIAAKFAMLAALLLQPYLMWWSPRRFSVLQETNGTQRAALYATTGSVLSLLIVVAVGLTAPLAVAWMFPPAYHDAMRYVPWLVLVMAIKDSAELLNLGCYTGKTTHAQLLINLGGAIVGVCAMLALVPLWGAWGAVVAMALAQTLRLLLYVVISQRLLPLPYPTQGLALMTLLTLAALWAGGQIHDDLARGLLAVPVIVLMTIAARRMRMLPWRPDRAGLTAA